MKKNYIAPSIELVNIKLQAMMTGSPDSSTADIDHGENTPESRRRGRNVWDDEDDWDY